MDKFNNDNVDKSLLSNVDSETNKSFVKKVTSRVSGLIPSSLSKWFGNSNNNSDNESTVRNRDDLEEDEEEELIIQPPMKKQRKLSGNDDNVDNHIPSNYYHHVNNGTYMESMPGPSNYKTIRSLSTIVHSNSNKSRTIDKETGSTGSSGYSSVIKNKDDLYNSSPIKEKKDSRRDTSYLFNSTPKPERSLFLDQLSSPNGVNNTSLSSRRPSFNASTFARGDPLAVANSPFYKGRTTYGGASAYNKLKFFKSTSNNNVSCRNTVQIRPNKESKATDKTSLSKTARRILETLEQYTSPLEETKKIPMPTIRRTALRDSLKSTYGHSRVNRDKISNRELQVPTVPDLLKMKLKERLQDSTVSVRELANTSKSELNKREYTIKTNEDTLSKHTNKIKTKITSTRSNKLNEEHLEEVELPNIQLPISTLPKFDFNLTNPLNSHSDKKNVEKNVTIDKRNNNAAVSNVIKDKVNFKPTPGNSIFASRTSKNNTQTFDVSPSKINVIGTSDQFKFSEPIVIATNMKYIKAINNYKFSEPIATKLDDNNGKAMAKKHNGDNTLQVQPSKEVITTGSVMDVLGKNHWASKFKPPEGTWECSVCLIRNKTEDDRCAACTTKRVNEKKEANVDLNKFKLTTDKWECSTCMVRNNNAENKCVACAAPKPVVNGSLSSAVKPVAKTSDLASLFKPAANTWECGVCMIRNKEEANKCAACESSKPQPSNNTKKFDLASLFKPPTNTWECGVCMIRNKDNANKCDACETPKPGAQSSSSFGDSFKKKENEWECSSCMVRNSSNNAKCVCCDTARPGVTKTVEIDVEPKKNTSTFNFGIDKNTFTFGIKPTENKSSEKTNDTLKGFTFGVTATTTSTNETKTFTFGVPKDTDKEIQNKGFVFGAQTENNVTTVENADKTKINVELPKTVESKTENKSNGPTFTFGKIASKDVNKTDKAASVEKQENNSNLFKFSNNETSANIQFGSVKRPSADSEPPAKRKIDSVDGATTPNVSFFDKSKANEQNKESKSTFTFGANNSKENSLFGANKDGASTFGTSKDTPTFGSTNKTPTLTTAKDNSAFATSKDTPIFGSAKNTTFAVNNDVPAFGASKGGSTFGGTKSSAIFDTSKSSTTTPITAFTSTKNNSFGNKETVKFGGSNSAFGTKETTNTTFGSKEGTTIFGTKGGTTTFPSKDVSIKFAAKEGTTFGPKDNAVTFGSKENATFTNVKDVPVFGKSTTFTDSKQNFTFNATSTAQNTNLFNNANTNQQQQTSLFTFGANNKNNTTELPKSTTATTTNNIFGASNTNIFGTTKQQQQQQRQGVTNEQKSLPSFSFTNTKSTENASNNTANTNNNNNLFTFGSAAAGTSNKPIGFNFNANQTNTDSKSLFNPSPQQQQSQQSNLFDNNNPLNGGFVFTQTKTPNSGFNFGNNSTSAPVPQQQQQQQQQQQLQPPPTQNMFNFGSNTTDNQSQNVISSTQQVTGFNFGNATPQFNANVRPTFNFTPSFTATGTPSDKPHPHRVMRKALRRTQR